MRQNKNSSSQKNQDKQLQKKWDDNKAKREAKKKEREDFQKAVIEEKQKQAQQMDKEAKKHEKMKKKFMKRVASENHLRAQIIKQQEQYAKVRREAIERSKNSIVKKMYEDRVLKESRKVKKKEKELMQMEMLEIELIKNLQNTQNIQKQSYVDLEKALMASKQAVGEGQLQLSIPIDLGNKKNSPKKKNKGKKDNGEAAEVQEELEEGNDTKEKFSED